MNSNPYIQHLNAVESKLQGLRARAAAVDRTDMPGTAVTGGSNVPASRLRKIDRQIDRRINLAVEIQKTQGLINHLRSCKQAYDDGRIDAQGRTIRHKKAKPVKPKQPPDPIKQKLRAVDQALSIYGRWRDDHIEIALYSYWNKAAKELRGLVLFQTTRRGKPKRRTFITPHNKLRDVAIAHLLKIWEGSEEEEAV